MLWLESVAGRERQRLTEAMITEGRIFPKMRGREVFRQAVSRFPEVIREALDANGLTVDDLDLLIRSEPRCGVSEGGDDLAVVPPIKEEEPRREVPPDTASD